MSFITAAIFLTAAGANPPVCSWRPSGPFRLLLHDCNQRLSDPPILTLELPRALHPSSLDSLNTARHFGGPLALLPGSQFSGISRIRWAPLHMPQWAMLSPVVPDPGGLLASERLVNATSVKKQLVEMKRRRSVSQDLRQRTARATSLLFNATQQGAHLRALPEEASEGEGEDEDHSEDGDHDDHHGEALGSGHAASHMQPHMLPSTAAASPGSPAQRLLTPRKVLRFHSPITPAAAQPSESLEGDTWDQLSPIATAEDRPPREWPASFEPHAAVCAGVHQLQQGMQGRQRALDSSAMLDTLQRVQALRLASPEKPRRALGTATTRAPLSQAPSQAAASSTSHFTSMLAKLRRRNPASAAVTQIPNVQTLDPMLVNDFTTGKLSFFLELEPLQPSNAYFISNMTGELHAHARVGSGRFLLVLLLCLLALVDTAAAFLQTSSYMRNWDPFPTMFVLFALGLSLLTVAWYRALRFRFGSTPARRCRGVVSLTGLWPIAALLSVYRNWRIKDLGQCCCTRDCRYRKGRSAKWRWFGCCGGGIFTFTSEEATLSLADIQILDPMRRVYMGLGLQASVQAPLMLCLLTWRWGYGQLMDIGGRDLLVWELIRLVTLPLLGVVSLLVHDMDAMPLLSREEAVGPIRGSWGLKPDANLRQVLEEEKTGGRRGYDTHRPMLSVLTALLFGTSPAGIEGCSGSTSSSSGSGECKKASTRQVCTVRALIALCCLLRMGEILGALIALYIGWSEESWWAVALTVVALWITTVVLVVWGLSALRSLKKKHSRREEKEQAEVIRKSESHGVLGMEGSRSSTKKRIQLQSLSQERQVSSERTIFCMKKGLSHAGGAVVVADSNRCVCAVSMDGAAHCKVCPNLLRVHTHASSAGPPHYAVCPRDFHGAVGAAGIGALHLSQGFHAIETRWLRCRRRCLCVWHWLGCSSTVLAAAEAYLCPDGCLACHCSAAGVGFGVH